MAASRLQQIVAHFLPASKKPPNFHDLNPTFFLPRAENIEPDAPAIVHTSSDGHSIRRNYREWGERTRGLAYYLKAKRYRSVGILLPNTPAFLECIFGIAAAGAMQTGINLRLAKEEIAYILAHSECDLVIVDKEYAHLIDGVSIDVLVDHDTDGDSSPYDIAVRSGIKNDQGWAALSVEHVDEMSVFNISYTSGTTSKPKGCEYTHRGTYLAALGNVIESKLNCQLADGSGRCKYLWTLPMFHALGWTFPYSVTAVRGTHVCLRKIDYAVIWRMLKEEGITHMNAAPTVNTLLVHHEHAARPENEVIVTVAGSAPTAHLIQEMQKLNLTCAVVYGLTETYGPASRCYFIPEWSNLPEDAMYKKMAQQGHGFVTSRELRVVKVENGNGKRRVVDVEKNGKDMGEILFQGNITMRGYYKNAGATKEILEDGWLHSGDLAVMHPDRSIQIMDRGKDLIISGGENISSLEVESVLIQHPAVLEVALVAKPDDTWGEIPKAYVTVKPEKTLEPSELIAFAKTRLGGYKAPREVEIISDMPKTETGKLRKNLLREWAKR